MSIIVVLSECYLQRLEEKSVALSFALNISPKIFKRHVDDSHVRFENKQKSLQFLVSNSNLTPSVSVSVFKGFLSRAYKICSERYIDEVVKLPSIPIIGPKLRQVFKKHEDHFYIRPKFKIVIMPKQDCYLTVIREYMIYLQLTLSWSNYEKDINKDHRTPIR